MVLNYIYIYICMCIYIYTYAELLGNVLFRTESLMHQCVSKQPVRKCFDSVWKLVIRSSRHVG